MPPVRRSSVAQDGQRGLRLLEWLRPFRFDPWHQRPALFHQIHLDGDRRYTAVPLCGASLIQLTQLQWEAVQVGLPLLALVRSPD